MAENGDTNNRNEPNSRYWQARCEQERKRADENLRLAAERAGEIADLQMAVKELAAYINTLQARLVELKAGELLRKDTDRLLVTCEKLVRYRQSAGALGFQLEKADDHLREIGWILEGC